MWLRREPQWLIQKKKSNLGVGKRLLLNSQFTLYLFPVKWWFCPCLFFFVTPSGVWLCFICCPLQGGSHLHPTPVIPLIVNTPFLSLNPKKLCLDLRLGRPSALPAGQLPDKVTARRSRRGQRATELPRWPRRAQARTSEDGRTWRGAQKSADVAGRRTSRRKSPSLSNWRNWTTWTEKGLKRKPANTHGATTRWLESAKELQKHYIHTTESRSASDRRSGSTFAKQGYVAYRTTTQESVLISINAELCK